MGVIKFITSLCILLVPPFYFAYHEQNITMGLAIIICVFAVIFINLDKMKEAIKVLKLKGFEIEFRDMIDKGYATIGELEDLKTVTASSVLSHVYWSGYIYGIPTTERFKIIKNYEKNLHENQKIELKQYFINNYIELFKNYLYIPLKDYSPQSYFKQLNLKRDNSNFSLPSYGAILLFCNEKNKQLQEWQQEELNLYKEAIAHFETNYFEINILEKIELPTKAEN